MSDINTNTEQTPVKPAPWSWYKKLGFRIIFVFLLAMSIPFASSWYSNVFTLDWFHPHYRDIYDIARFQPSFQRFFGGRGGFDDDSAPAGNAEKGDGNGGQRSGGGKRHHGGGSGADSTRGGGFSGNAADTGANRHFHRHHHQRDSTGGANGEVAGNFKHHHHDFAGATGNQPDPAAEGGDQGFRHHRHHRDSTLTNNENGGFANGGEHHHHHHRDSTFTGNAGGGYANGGEHHHHHRDSTLTGSGDGHFANGGGHHHHHHGDSTLIASQQFNSGSKIIGDGHHHKNHGDQADSTGHDSAKVAAGGRFNRPGRDNLGGNIPPANRSFLSDYTDWGIAFLIGVVGGLIWTALDRKSKSYNILYYWIRVVVRYRAGIGIIGFGFTKLFPTQMPFPSLGLLNSNFGDFTAQKIYWMSVGIVPWYQVFGGIVEIAAGTMLFFRKTTTLGAILLAGALGDITFVNYAYDGGVHVYAFYFVFLSLFLIADDVPKLYNLLILEKYTVPFRIYPDFTKPWLKYTRIGLKALTFLIFFVILTYTEVINFKYDPYKQPSTAGVKQLRGNYHVSTFKINGQEIAYNPLDTVRWQEATFENWTTLTFKVNHPVIIDPSNGGGSPMKDIQRTFEITGVAGGQRAFHYYADTIDKVLYLEDKNAIALRAGRRGGRGGRNGNRNRNQGQDNWISKTAWQHIGDEKKMIDPHAWSTRRDREFAQKFPEPKRSRMILNYSTTDGSEVILTGINEHRDSIYVVLNRYDRKYVLPKSSLSAGKY
jgi:hypothetical protein